MNENPTVEVNKLQPITKFIYTLGVLPTSYLMSMTFQEQVTWLCNYISQTVIPAINDNVEAVQELQNIYKDLQDFVNNYFDDLNVQEEINNKLDQMATSGEFNAIIQQYVDPLYQGYVNEINGVVANQNTEINNFKSSVNSEINSFETNINNRITSIASGSPLVATSTSEMTDTSRVYVNTTDGKWYYYDGDSWEIGGTYQSTEISDNSIYYNMLETPLQSNININNLTTSSITTTGAYYEGNIGSTINANTSGSNFQCGYISVNPNDIIISDWFGSHDYGVVNPLLLTNSDNEIIEKFERSDLYDNDSKRPKKFVYKIPSNVSKVYFNSRTNVPWYISIVTGYNYLDTRVNNQLNNTATVTPTSTIANKLYSLYYWGGDQNNYTTNVYSVNPGDKMHINMELYPNAYAVPGIFLDSNSKPIAYIDGANTTQGWVTIDKDFIVPYNATQLYCSINNARPMTLSKYTFSDIDLTEKKKMTVQYSSGTLLMTNNSNGNTLTMKHSTTGNNLFEIVGYKVNNITKTFETDMIPSPYIVKAVNNGNGDRTSDGFTGGQHKYSNNEYDGTATAEEISLAIYVDNVDISNEASVSRQGNEVKIVEVNRVQATNTCLEAGGGRNVLEEKIVFTYDGRELDVVNTITPLEDINLLRYYGIQTASFSDSDYKIYADKIYTVSNQLQCPKKPDMIFGGDIICARLYSEGLGDYRLNSVQRKVNVSNSKSYYVPVYTETENIITSGTTQYIHGCYVFDYIQK